MPTALSQLQGMYLGFVGRWLCYLTVQRQKCSGGACLGPQGVHSRGMLLLELESQWVTFHFPHTATWFYGVADEMSNRQASDGKGNRDAPLCWRE